MTSIDETFVCQHFSKTFAHRHCLRRQVDLQEATDPKTGQRVPGPPVHAYCASGNCEAGAAIRAQHTDVRIASCSACGHALIGPEPCPRCAAREVGKQVPHVLPARVPMSTRLWTDPPVEPPFVPPKQTARAPATPPPQPPK
jgi:hypothetical protein